jgi:hypothetical protein
VGDIHGVDVTVGRDRERIEGERDRGAVRSPGDRFALNRYRGIDDGACRWVTIVLEIGLLDADLVIVLDAGNPGSIGREGDGSEIEVEDGGLSWLDVWCSGDGK